VERFPSIGAVVLRAEAVNRRELTAGRDLVDGPAAATKTGYRTPAERSHPVEVAVGALDDRRIPRRFPVSFVETRQAGEGLCEGRNRGCDAKCGDDASNLYESDPLHILGPLFRLCADVKVAC